MTQPAPSPRREADRLDFESEGRDWPNRDHSRFVEAGGLRFHVQEMGEGPVALLLHGTGASTHSWRDVAPLLARDFRVVAIDLPGHGFTEGARFEALSLPGMAAAVGALVKVLHLDVALGVGHSAGAAVLIRMALDGLIAPKLIVSLNGAIKPLQGLAGQIFQPIARMLVLLPVTPHLFAWRASNPEIVDELLGRTGSRLDPGLRDIYQRLFRNPAHVAGALGMMANWDLPSLDRDLPRLKTPLLLIAGALDGMVPPEDAGIIAGRVAGARAIRLKGLGHLAHEEEPALIADLVRRAYAGMSLDLPPERGSAMTFGKAVQPVIRVSQRRRSASRQS